MTVIEPEVPEKELSFFHHIYECATKILSKRGHLDPVAFFRTGEHPQMQGLPSKMIVPVQMEMPGNDTGKDALAQALRHLVKQTDADLVLMVLESWMVMPSKEEAEYIKREGCFQVPPSKHPNRIEIVLFNLSKSNGDSWSAWVQITRDADQKPSIPQQPPKLEYLKSEGRFGNLFDEDDQEDAVTIVGGLPNAATTNN